MEIDRLGATAVQLEARDSQNTGCHPRNREQSRSFRRFRNKHGLFRFTPEFMKIHACLGIKTFFCLFWSSPQNSWKFARLLR